MVFIETPMFTADVVKYLSEERYAELQQALAGRPDIGAIVTGSGGLRKVRWGAKGKGKRGGVRVIYYWRVSESQILMLAIYGKGEKDDLSTADRRALRKIVEGWK